MRIGLLAAGAAALCLFGATGAASSAYAENFYYSFQGDPTLGMSGTVSGEIFGLPTTGTADPTNVTAEYDGVTYQTPNFGTFGNITTTNGQITGSAYQTYLDPGPPTNLTLGLVELGVSFDQLITPSNGVVLNAGGFSAIKFTPASAAPEPSTWALMIIGIAGLGVAMRRAKAHDRRRGAFEMVGA